MEPIKYSTGGYVKWSCAFCYKTSVFSEAEFFSDELVIPCHFCSLPMQKIYIVKNYRLHCEKCNSYITYANHLEGKLPVIANISRVKVRGQWVDYEQWCKQKSLNS